MTRTKRILFLLVMLVLVVGCDRATKRIAMDQLVPGEQHSLLGGIVLLEYAENKGAFLGLGSLLPEQVRLWILIVGVGLILTVALGYLLAAPDLGWVAVLCLSAIVAGGAGNLYDRIVHGGVVIDFVSLGLGPLRTGIFNVADLGVTFGAVALALSSWLSSRQEGTTRGP